MIEIPGKIPIRIFPFFWLIAFFIGFLATQSSTSPIDTSMRVLLMFVWAGIVVFSVLIHEYGHALTAVAFGQRAKIDLVGLGGQTERQGPPLKLWKEFLIVLAGPVFGFLIVVIAYILLQKIGSSSNTLLAYALENLFVANILWTIVNLFPILPLDGGNLIKIILQGLFGQRGIKFALTLSIVLGGAVSLLFFANGQLFAGTLFLLLAYENYKTWKEGVFDHAQGITEDLQNELKEAMDFSNQGEIQQAIEKIQEVRQKAGQGRLYIQATELLAHLLYRKGENEQAYQLLSSLKQHLNPSYEPILQQIAYEKGNYQEALQWGLKSYREDPKPETAFLNALSSAKLNFNKETLNWLEAAIRQGLENPSTALKHPEFDAIRSSEAFQQLLRRVDPT